MNTTLLSGTVKYLLAVSFIILLAALVARAQVEVIDQTYNWVKDRDNTLDIEVAISDKAQEGDLILMFQGTSGRKPDVPTGNGGPWTFIANSNKKNEDNDDKYGNCSNHAWYKAYDPNGGNIVGYIDGSRKFIQVVVVRGADLDNPVVDYAYTKPKINDVEIGQDGTFFGPSVKTEKDGAVFSSTQFDDKILMRQALVGGEDMPIIIFNQKGDDGSVLAVKEGSDGTDSGEVQLDWTGNDTRTSLVYAITMTLSLRAGAALLPVTGSVEQTTKTGVAIEAIEYTWKNDTGVEVSGLPAGINVDIDTELNKVVLSGTPSAFGVFEYTITTTKGATVNGVFTVYESTAKADVITQQDEGSTAQTLTEGESVETLSFTWEESTTVIASGDLPEGVTAVIDNVTKKVTFSGTPTEVGEFTYTVTTSDGSATQSVTFVVEAQIVLSVSDVNETPRLSVYPNPMSAEATVKFSLSKPSDVSLKIYNMQGMVVKDISSNQYVVGMNQVAIDRSGLESGIYLLSVNTPKESMQMKLLVK